MRVQHGFTLVELLVVVAVAAILVGIAVPSFQSIVNGNQLAGASNEIVASLQTARMEAIRRNRRVVVCASANANAGTDATCANAGIDGFITFVDTNADNDFDKVGDTLLRNSPLAGNVDLSGDAVVSYRSDGLARDAGGALLTAGAIRLRIDTRQPSKNVRCVDITTGGAAVRTPDDHDADCS